MQESKTISERVILFLAIEQQLESLTIGITIKTGENVNTYTTIDRSSSSRCSILITGSVGNERSSYFVLFYKLSMRT